MPKLIDLTNQKFGKLTVISRGENDSQNKPQWNCICECGKAYLARGYGLRKGTITQCPDCGKKKAIAARNQKIEEKIKNKKFGFLIVIEKDFSKENGADKQQYWICQCDCGKTVSLTSSQLLQGLQVTCGYGCPYRSQNISEKKTEDLTGKIFGALTVIERDLDKPNSKKNRTSQWKCKCQCGNELTVSRSSLINRTRQCCNLCLEGKSIGEKKIEIILRENNIKFQSEVSFSDLKGIHNGAPRFDFVIYDKNNKIQRIIEFDGEFHYIHGNFWNSETVKENDKIKNEYCRKNNIPLIRIPYWERDNITLEMIMGEEFLCKSE